MSDSMIGVILLMGVVTISTTYKMFYRNFQFPVWTLFFRNIKIWRSVI